MEFGGFGRRGKLLQSSIGVEPRDMGGRRRGVDPTIVLTKALQPNSRGIGRVEVS